jgi:hypothetical protein
MPALLTAASTMTCPHGGVVTATPAGSAQTGGPILRGSDGFVITGCAFNVAGVPSPCVSVNWVQTATRVKCGGDFALNQSSVGLCLAASQAPQGTVLIVATQASVNGI